MPGHDRSVRKWIAREAISTVPACGRGGGREVPFFALPALTQSWLRANDAKTQAWIKSNAQPAVREVIEKHEDAAAKVEARYKALWAAYEACSARAKSDAQRKALAAEAVFGLLRRKAPAMWAYEIVARHYCGGIPTAADGEPAWETFAHAAILEAKGPVPAAPHPRRASVIRWRARVVNQPRGLWVPLLVPCWKGGGRRTEIPEDIWKTFFDIWGTQSKQPVAVVYRKVVRLAKKDMPEVHLPKAAAFARRLKLVPWQVRICLREGEEALRNKTQSQERDHGQFRALERITADGHKFDVLVEWEDGSVSRPILLAIQDIPSGKILAWRIDKTENSDLIRLTYYDVIRNYGIPGAAYLDNGRAFASKFVSGGAHSRNKFKAIVTDPLGVFGIGGTRVVFCLPYSGRSKPIERAFRDIEDLVGKHGACVGAYTGNRPENKPENAGTKTVPESVFRGIVGKALAAHNAQEGRKSKACHGRSFDETFNEDYAKGPIKKPTEEQLRLCRLAARRASCTSANGAVELYGSTYHHPNLAALFFERPRPELVVYFDPDDLKKPVSVYRYNHQDGTETGEFICDAECQDALFETQDGGEAHIKARSAVVKDTRRLIKSMGMLSAAEAEARIPDVVTAPLPIPAVITAAFGGMRMMGGRGEKRDNDGFRIDDPEQIARCMANVAAVGGGRPPEYDEFGLAIDDEAAIERCKKSYAEHLVLLGKNPEEE
jgi:hypothetical protein